MLRGIYFNWIRHEKHERKRENYVKIQRTGEWSRLKNVMNGKVHTKLCKDWKERGGERVRGREIEVQHYLTDAKYYSAICWKTVLLKLPSK